jgi:tetratricopeptide (TPR) repeat protein/tRNA A-37 threonylcarbamoyl transferase component Bud32
VRLRELFDEVSDLSDTARARYFAEHQVSPATRNELEDLLSFDGVSDTSFERNVGQLATAALDHLDRSNAGYGPYRLCDLLGRGGMGAVYSAERIDGEVTRKVAIKVLHPGADIPTIRKRFVAERQIMASLNHPGIAALLDAGHTSDGRPYLVMDYIDGVPLDVYARNLDVRSTLRLFVRVCEAVSYAHQNLIVHRDIKPSNILVDKSGQPKLLDFGIAKLLERENQVPATLLTREGGLLTPAYAAPEQVTGGHVTTATDVYALGVLLFVLLTGEHPAEGVPQSYSEMRWAALFAEPKRLSEVMPRDRLRGPFRGDLDTIVGKALKKDPIDRYASAAALAGDVRRYLDHQPIEARPDTLAYRGAKLVRRHRAPFAFAVLALLACVAGAVATLNEARIARVQRDFALRQLSRAEALNDLNSYVLSDAAPSGKLFSVDDLLARSKGIIERQRGRDDLTRVDLLISNGRQYTVQDEYAKARPLLEEAYHLSRGVTDGSTRGRAACALAQTLSRSGELIGAEALFEEGMTALPTQPLQGLDRIFCLERGAEVASNAGDAGTAVKRAESARALVTQLPIPSDLAEMNTLISLASAESNAGRFNEAARAFEQAAERLGELGRADTQRAGTVFNNWGVALLRAGRPLEAAGVLRRSIEISMTDKTDASVQAMPLVNYACALFDLRKVGDAQRYAEKGLAKAKQAGDEMPVRKALLLLPAIYRAEGDLERAGKIVSEAALRLHDALPPRHGMFADLALQRALNAEAAGQLGDAWKYSNEAVSIAEEAATQGAVYRLWRFLICRSGIALQLGRLDTAQADAARAIGILRDGDKAESSSGKFARAYLALGRALKQQGKRTDARAAFRSSAEHFRIAFGPDHPDTLSAYELGGADADRVRVARR